MSTTAKDAWSEHTRTMLAQAGHRDSAPRKEVIEALAELRCSVTAREIADRLRERGSTVGLASIYRTLELLDRMHLVQRFDVGEGVARYEPAHPGGEHHHHVVCDTCGTLEAFEDEGLERAIARLAGKTDYVVAAHDVTLHGTCPACSTPG